jgi:transketolase C-terminal domain/subunit
VRLHLDALLDAHNRRDALLEQRLHDEVRPLRNAVMNVEVDLTQCEVAVRVSRRQVEGNLRVVAENHSVIGGLGEAVASALLRNRVQPEGFQLAGLPDAFLEAGALPTLHDRYGISRGGLAARIKGWLG